jgi:hypothetical protein
MTGTQSAMVALTHGRQHDRTHLFVAAILHSGTGSCPVNVRNISTSGALIEGAIAPGPGATVTLMRGSLQVSATILWKLDRQAGIAFSSPLQVADWMPLKAGAHQGQVDGMIDTIRSGTGDRPGGPMDRRPDSLDTELRALRSEIAQLGDALVKDTLLIAAHPEIQLIDIALQRIDRMLLDIGKP